MSLKNPPTKTEPFVKNGENGTLPVQVIEPDTRETKETLNKKNYKISETDKQMLVALYASGYTPTEVSERAKTEYNISVTPENIIHYGQAEKWQPLMRKVREARMNDLAAVSGSYKRVRLERHEKIFEKALKKGDLKNAITATESQRKEMEGDSNMSLTLNQFNVLTDDELENKKKQVMDRIKLITEKTEKQGVPT